MFYVIDENHNMVEAYDKEGVLAVLAQAIKDGSLSGITADSAFVSKLKCCVSGETNKIAFVTQQKYNELEASNSVDSNTYYYITDDTTMEDIGLILNELTAYINGVRDGSVAVATADEAKKLKIKSFDENSIVTERGIYFVQIRSLYHAGHFLQQTFYINDLNQGFESWLNDVNETSQVGVRYDGLTKKISTINSSGQIMSIFYIPTV